MLNTGKVLNDISSTLQNAEKEKQVIRITIATLVMIQFVHFRSRHFKEWLFIENELE